MKQPNFEHRAPDSYSEPDFIDKILNTTRQAEAVAYQMQSQYIGGCSNLSDEVNFSALDSIILQLEDIRSIVMWYCQNHKEDES